MTPRQHAALLLQAIAVWGGFWLLGWPAYYQQYSTALIAVASILLSVGISLAAVFVAIRSRPEVRESRAFWIALYYTVPFAALDSWYCGIHLGHGAGYLVPYWYLSVFYVTPWLTFPPTAWLLRGYRGAPT
jgi:hypothetical protein